MISCFLGDCSTANIHRVSPEEKKKHTQRDKKKKRVRGRERQTSKKFKGKVHNKEEL